MEPHEGRQQGEEAIRAIIRQVEDGWNVGSGEAFAAPFANDADYVIVNGDHISGREAIGAGHQHIFSTIYKGSTDTLTVERIRYLRPDIAIAHVQAHLKLAGGDAPREAKARSTWVLTKDGGQWSIAAFQNTPIASAGETH